MDSFEVEARDATVHPQCLLPSLWIYNEMSSHITEIISTACSNKSLCRKSIASHGTDTARSSCLHFFEIMRFNKSKRGYKHQCILWPLDLNITLPLQWVQKDNMPRHFSPHSSKFWKHSMVKNLFSNLDLAWQQCYNWRFLFL